MVIATLQEHVGATRTDLCRRTGLAWGTVGYHLHRMVRDGRVQRIEDGTQVRFAPAGEDPGEVRRSCLLRERTTAAVVALLRRAPAGPTSVARHLGLPIKRTRAVLDRLEAEGVLGTDGAYHPTFWVATRRLRHACAGRPCVARHERRPASAP